MILHALHALATFCGDPTHGVNAQLASVPRVSGHVEPPPVTIVSELTVGWVSAGRVPKGLASHPYLALYQAEQAEVDGERHGTYRRATVTVGLRYLATQTALELGTRAAHYTLAAAQRTLRRFFADDAVGRAAREPAGLQIQIERTTSWRQLPVFDAYEDAVSVGVLLVPLTIRNLNL